MKIKDLQRGDIFKIEGIVLMKVQEFTVAGNGEYDCIVLQVGEEAWKHAEPGLPMMWNSELECRMIRQAVYYTEGITGKTGPQGIEVVE